MEFINHLSNPAVPSSTQHNTETELLSLVPRPFPPPVFDRILYAVCDQKLEAGTAWERG